MCREVITMKKLLASFLLAVFFVFAMAATAFAANWVWVESDDRVGIFFDSESVKFEHAGESINDNIIYVWWYMQFDDAYAQQRPFHGKVLKRLVFYDKFNLKDQTITHIDAVAYDRSGDTVDRGADGKTSRIIPGTKQETLMNAVSNYAKKYKDEIDERTRK